MTARKKNRKWPLELKKQIVQDYVSGAKTAAQLAKENGFEGDPNRIYRWRHEMNQIKQGEQIDDLKAKCWN